MLPAASRPRSEIAISVPASGWPFGGIDQAFDAAVGGQRLDGGRHADRLAAGAQAVAAVVEAQDFVGALDADIERAAVIGERFGVVPVAPRGDRPAVGPEDRRHFGVGDRDRAGRRA